MIPIMIKFLNYSSFQFLIILFSLSNLAAWPCLTPLLSLNCSQPSNHNPLQAQSIQSFIHNLSSQLLDSQFNHAGRFNGFMQCRAGLGRTACSHCVRDAISTAFSRCPDSDSVATWFDGCYIQYSSVPRANLGAANRSCSTTSTSDADRFQFEQALETLLLRLRAEASVATRHGFSYGHLAYGAGDRKIYGLVECLRFLSPKDCIFCLGEAIGKLQGLCGGKTGGTVVSGLCLVRFESYEFYSFAGAVPVVGDGGSDSVTVSENKTRGLMGFKVIKIWLGGAGFFTVIMVLACLLKRSVMNKAKVAVVVSGEDGFGRK